MVFFAQNTRACGKVKLFKLLYLLDFEHFTLTGKSVTGLEYQAWKFGPVPVELMEEWEDFSTNFSGKLCIEVERVIDFNRQSVKVVNGVEFDEIDFTPRQLKLMGELAERFRETASPELIDLTHVQNGAWHRVWDNGSGKFQTIPYRLALSDLDSATSKEVISIANEESMYFAGLQQARTESAVH